MVIASPLRYQALFQTEDAAQRKLLLSGAFFQQRDSADKEIRR